MGAGAGVQEADDPERSRVDLPQAGVVLIGGVDDGAVRRELDVLGRARTALEHERVDHPLRAQVDLDHPPGELAAGERVAAVGGEVHVVDPAAVRHVERVDEPHRGRIAEVEALEGLGDDDGVAAVGREVQVVGILDRDRPSGPPGPRVDRGEAVAEIVVDVQGAEVPGRRHVLGQLAGGEVLDDPERPLVDHVDGRAHAVRHVHVRGISADGGREVARPIVGVDIEGSGGMGGPVLWQRRARRPRHGAGVAGRATTGGGEQGEQGEQGHSGHGISLRRGPQRWVKAW